ncbi:hypothetical protein OAG1_25610 [Agarivorans sp. OAG1]|uniref:GNAT family N-acetyltransferase n=1 Tax=Agarivorans sp. OAG1 TaxID=3082387 RepID=UPI002B2ED769|nr:hypothetical protein OAG1_25610 [Agarivorans sp. OAG1]
MAKFEFSTGELAPMLNSALAAGFEEHSQSQQAPAYHKQRLNWTLQNAEGKLIAALTADLLWDWLYIDELWVDDSCRGQGMGQQLMQQAEDYARDKGLSGLWLWTQSWQAPAFYERLGFSEFTCFDNFPVGHCRIGLRKAIAKD